VNAFDLITACWLGIIGACIGSFLNVVAYRMPLGMSVVWKPSHCPKCGHAIRARDNLPVLGWLLLRGRCRDCRAPISPRYAVVEALMGLAFVALAYAELISGGANLPAGAMVETRGAWDNVWNPVNGRLIGLFAFHGVLLALLMAYALIDLDRQKIPIKLALFALVLAGIAAYNWPMWYPERIRTTYVRELKAPLDALFGAAWGALPWLAALSVYNQRGGTRWSTALLNTAIALGTIGAFLGLRAVVRVTIVHLLVAVALRLLPERYRPHALVVAPLWPLSLALLMFWRTLAPLLNW
jgi:prepilin signal peptidase PulO-like enzyme (type II secretory pathway)